MGHIARGGAAANDLADPVPALSVERSLHVRPGDTVAHAAMREGRAKQRAGGVKREVDGLADSLVLRQPSPGGKVAVERLVGRVILVKLHALAERE